MDIYGHHAGRPKPMDSSFLRKVLGLGKFRIYDDTSSLKENPDKKFSARWVEAFGETRPPDSSTRPNGGRAPPGTTL